MAGIAPDQIPDAEQREVMDLLWEAPEVAIMTIGPVQRHPWREPEEVVRFGVCPKVP
jgi:hypothetical protein